MTNRLLDSAEKAFQRLLLTNLPAGSTVLQGLSSSNKTLPLVICAADGDSQTEDPPLTGNFWIDVEISVKGSSSTQAGATTDPLEDDQSLAKLVFDILTTTDLDSKLNAQGFDFTVFPRGFFLSPFKSGRDEQGVYVDQLPIKLYCCASVIAP